MLYSKPRWLKATVIYSHRHAGQGLALLISPGLPHVLGVGGGWLIWAGRSALGCKSGWVWATCLSSSLDRELAHVCYSYGYSRGTGRQAKTQRQASKGLWRPGPSTGTLIPLALCSSTIFRYCSPEQPFNIFFPWLVSPSLWNSLKIFAIWFSFYCAKYI